MQLLSAGYPEKDSEPFLLGQRNNKQKQTNKKEASILVCALLSRTRSSSFDAFVCEQGTTLLAIGFFHRKADRRGPTAAHCPIRQHVPCTNCTERADVDMCYENGCNLNNNGDRLREQLGVGGSVNLGVSFILSPLRSKKPYASHRAPHVRADWLMSLCGLSLLKFVK